MQKFLSRVIWPNLDPLTKHLLRSALHKPSEVDQCRVESRHFCDMELGSINDYGFVAQNVRYLLPFSESESDHLVPRKSSFSEAMFRRERFWRLTSFSSFDSRFLAPRKSWFNVPHADRKLLIRAFKWAPARLWGSTSASSVVERACWTLVWSKSGKISFLRVSSKSWWHVTP